MFYINIYVLVPYFFFRGRYVIYLAVLAVVVMAGLSSMSYILNTRLGAYRIVEDRAQDFYEGTIVSICVILVTTTLKLLQRWAKDNERIAELKNLALRMELNELRNQINPHFLFNMLNNVKALIRTNPEMAITVIMKLSEFLRFQLYENSEEKTLLTSEINFLSNYVNLEKIRRDNLFVTIDSKLGNPPSRSVFVPPNLFIMFVENAVKHSVDFTEKGSHIAMQFEAVDNKLRFSCVNSVNPAYAVSDKPNSSGLGLVNIKRRLELLYQDNYRLDISATTNEYKVDLIIPI
jgi:LytS/YehU family sensor histidine kinase